MCEKGELGIVPKWEEDKWWIIISVISASPGQPHGLEDSEEMVTVPLTCLTIPRHSSLHACGFLGLQKE